MDAEWWKEVRQGRQLFGQLSAAHLQSVLLIAVSRYASGICNQQMILSSKVDRQYGSRAVRRQSLLQEEVRRD